MEERKGGHSYVSHDISSFWQCDSNYEVEYYPWKVKEQQSGHNLDRVKIYNLGKQKTICKASVPTMLFWYVEFNTELWVFMLVLASRSP